MPQPDLRATLRRAAIRYDRWHDGHGRPGNNLYPLEFVWPKIEQAVELVEQGTSIRQALCVCFNGRLLARMVEAVGQPKVRIKEARRLRRCANTN